MSQSQILTRTLSADHVTPVRAYAALRAQSPGRSSFLFESVLQDERWGRYSVLGYRARSEHAYPPGTPALAMLADDAAALESAETLAGRLSQSLVGYVSYDAAHLPNGIPLWPNEGMVARLMRDATVVVFDHLELTMTIAGRSKGAIERCAWEMTHGPELDALPAPDPASEALFAEPNLDDDAYAMKVARAKALFSPGDCEGLVLARTFRAPMRNADALDAYRALRLLAPSAYLFFLDFAETPFAEGVIVAGASPGTMVRVEQGKLETGEIDSALPEGATAVDYLRAAFPAAALVGTPKKRAMQIIRQLEPGPRGIYGGAVGYVSPDGTADFAIGMKTIVVMQSAFEVTAGAAITATSEGGEAAEQTRREARIALAAVRSAQDAAERREAREEAKRKKAEEEERKKAEAEAAAAAQADAGAEAAAAADVVAGA